MSTLFATLLILHILSGLTGVIYSFRVTFLLLKKEIVQMTIARTAYFAFASYIISWVAGGWYYWKYYGSNVKPAITSGDFPWAHIVFMESKEHIFLFLPFKRFCNITINISSIYFCSSFNRIANFLI